MTYGSCYQFVIVFIEGRMELISVLDIMWKLVPQAMHCAL